MNNYSTDISPGRTFNTKEKEYLFFSGYGYLGVQHIPEFSALVKEGIDKYGWLFPSSRISNTQLSLYKECEALLSSITGMEETVLTSSGFNAGRLATGLFKDEVMNVQFAHPAIFAANKTDKNVYALNSVNPLTASINNIEFETDHHNKIVIIDDSHGFGLIGKNGEGIVSKLPSSSSTKYIIAYALSKACSINAGAVSCNKTVANELRKLPIYAAATAPSPALLYAFIKGQHIYAEQRKKLCDNMQYFQACISTLKDVYYHKEIPIFILPPYINEAMFEQNNIIISSFAYPDIDGEKTHRIVLNALHTKNDLDQLAETLFKAFANNYK
jgi:7-keto-8-aminopelargonate synthetase-like enzyme